MVLLLVVGAPGDMANPGAVFVFARAGTAGQIAALRASNAEAGDQFGEQVSLTEDGAQLAVAAVGEDSAATVSEATGMTIAPLIPEPSMCSRARAPAGTNRRISRHPIRTPAIHSGGACIVR